MVLAQLAAFRRRKWVVRRLDRRLRQDSRRRLRLDRPEWLRLGRRLRRRVLGRRQRWLRRRLRHLPWGLAGHLRRLRPNTAECLLVRLQVLLVRLQVLRLLRRRRLRPRSQPVEFPVQSRSSLITAANDSS